MNSLSLPRTRRGFTLIELLTVIAIIGILAAIIIPTVGKVRATARGAKCASNLRSVGTAMLLYADDNKGVLPGPFWGSQGTPDANMPGHVTYRADPADNINLSNGGNIPVRLGAYMGIPANGQMVSSNLFLCPEAAVNNPAGPSWYVTTRIDATKGSGTNNNGGGYTSANGGIELPFGSVTDTSKKPKNIREINAVSLGASRLWAVIDNSNTIPGGHASPIATIANGPVHGSHSNAVFFDAHVGKIGADGTLR